MMLTAPNISRTRHRVMSRAFKCKIAGNLWRCVVTRALLLMVSGEVTGGHFRNFNHQSSGSTWSGVCMPVVSRWPVW